MTGPVPSSGSQHKMKSIVFFSLIALFRVNILYNLPSQLIVAPHKIPVTFHFCFALFKVLCYESGRNS